MAQPTETRAEAFARLEGEGRIALETIALAAGNDAGDLPSEIEVILTGDYQSRKFKMTSEMIDEMIANHASSGVDPAIDREHESWFGGPGAEARGWVKSLSRRPAAADARRQALVAQVEWTDLGQQALSKKHFRYVSAGVFFNAKDRQSEKPIGTFLDHVALVKHPFVQGMKPAANSAGTPVQGEIRMSKIALALGLAADTDEDKLVEALSTRLDVAEKAKAAAETEATTAKSHTEALSKRVDELEVINRAAEAASVAAEVDAAVAAFKLKPAEREEYIALGRVNRSTMSKLIGLRDAQDPSGKLALKTVTKPAGDARIAAQNKAVAEWLSAHPGKDEAQAFMACALEQPDLFADIEGV